MYGIDDVGFVVFVWVDYVDELVWNLEMCGIDEGFEVSEFD